MVRTTAAPDKVEDITRRGAQTVNNFSLHLVRGCAHAAATTAVEATVGVNELTVSLRIVSEKVSSIVSIPLMRRVGFDVELLWPFRNVSEGGTPSARDWESTGLMLQASIHIRYTGLVNDVVQYGEERKTSVSSSSVIVHNTHRRGLHSVSISVPHSRLIIVANLSNSNGDSLTFSAVCTRNRHQCIRDLSDCTHRFLNRVSGPSLSSVSNLSPTISVSRGAASGGPHSAINAMARVCSCLHLLFTHINAPRYPRYNHIVRHRAASRITSGILTTKRNHHTFILTPIIHKQGNRCAGLFRSLHTRNFDHIHISNRIHSLSSPVSLSGGFGRSVRIIISHVIVHRGSLNHVTRSIRRTATLTRNGIGMCLLPSHSTPRKARNRLLRCSLTLTYPRRKRSVSSLRPHSFSFGTPCNTYPRYSNLNFGGAISTRTLVRSPSGSVTSKIFNDLFNGSGCCPRVFTTIYGRFGIDISAP